MGLYPIFATITHTDSRVKKMKRIRFLLALTMLICFLASCKPRMYRKVVAGCDATVAGLPQSDAYVVVTTLRYEVDRDWGEGTCYIGEALIALGTNMSEEEALRDYVEQLNLQGWTERKLPIEYSESIELIRNDKERMIVHVGNPGFLIESDETYQKAQDLYPTFVFLMIHYYLPDREMCFGQ